ncbi:Gag-Pol polyprotein [Gossypium australe]|uniref:Gag-Pol polyprotein n=1 Tax=Gossypium australe TaxID=47621 RepID=A0A5B6VC03_9ROSI|nr:Gag-Pol polyprotein [Gossypium australe]
MMSEWFSEFVRTNPAAQQPPPPQVLVVPQVADPIRLNKPIYVAEEFRATADDDAERAEFWLENNIRVFDEMSLTPDEYQKRKEFLELKQGRMSVTNQYARECVSTKATRCKHFIEGLNEDIKLLVGILDINEFVVLVERACKAEELSKEKKKADSEARDERKRSMSKSYQSPSKRFGDAANRSNASFGHSGRDRVKQSVGPRTQILTESSVGSVKSNKPECRQCGRQHVGECWGKYNNRNCYKCGSRDHFIPDCPELAEKDSVQNARPSNTTARGRPPRNTGNMGGSQRGTTDTAMRPEARAPARAYAICAREEASSQDIIRHHYWYFYSI